MKDLNIDSTLPSNQQILIELSLWKAKQAFEQKMKNSATPLYRRLIRMVNVYQDTY